MDCYLTFLAATDIVLGSIRGNTSERRAAVNTFLTDYWYYKDIIGSLISSHAQIPLLSASIDYESDVQPGDYGILVPGQQCDCSFQAYGNVVKDSCGVISNASGCSWIYNYTDETFADEVQGSLRT